MYGLQMFASSRAEFLGWEVRGSYSLGLGSSSFSTGSMKPSGRDHLVIAIAIVQEILIGFLRGLGLKHRPVLSSGFGSCLGPFSTQLSTPA